MAASVKEVLPPSLDSTSQPPPLFDGTTRLYTNYQCPFAQRVWITRNYKGLQDKIKLVPIDLVNRPAWYKEKVYPENKVPSLEHDNKIVGESLDLVKYVDAHFEGPTLLPDDPAKREFAEDLLTYTSTFNGTVYSSFKGDTMKEAGVAFDYLESALQKFEGPFFLGQVSLVDFAYIPFVERLQIFLQEVYKYDITSGRPKLATWVEELNKIDAYVETKCDPEHVVQLYKKRFLGLQDKIKLVPIDLANKPTWYKEKVCPENKVPCLEDDNKIIVDSIDMVKYIDAHFEGTALLPEEAAKREFAEDLLAYTNTFIGTAYASFKGDTEEKAGAAFDYLESALEKFEGPFLLGEVISLVDIVYIPFVERVDIFLKEVFKYDISSGRPKVAKWIQELNKIDAYLDTKVDPAFVVQMYKKRYLGE